jgi:hypothetical protein
MLPAQITNNSVWTEYDINIQSNYIVSKHQYWTANDTVIHGLTYTKIVDKDRYLGAIREENGKVYAYLNYGEYMVMEDEFLLYDFTVEAGDVITSTASEGALSDPDGITVLQVDEITLENGEKRKRIFFDKTEPWIEGIGSIRGLFHDTMWLLTNYTVSYLVCFQQNDISLYVDTDKCLDEKCCENITTPDSQNVFPESDAIWNIHAFRNGDFFKEYLYGLSGDTIINDKKYNKLYFLNDTTLNIDNNDIYVGGFRLENKQVWFLLNSNPDNWVDEYILYDFSKEVSEISTILHVPAFDNIVPDLTAYGIDNFTRTITKIEETLTGKTFDIDITGNPWIRNSQWIEGIGSIKGLFWEYITYPMSVNDAECRLACFKQGNVIKYMDNNISNTCFCYNNTGMSNVATNAFLIFPNKQTSSIEIFINWNDQSSYFELFNLQGQRLIKEPVNSRYRNISCNNLNRGLYIYRITDQKGVSQSGKILLK